MSPIRTERINHPALIAADVEETIRFYTEVLGMELVLRQPNLDDPDSEHLFFDAGGDTFIAFFGPRPGLPPNRVRAQPGVGYMMHLAFDVDEQTFEQAQDELKRRGIRFSGPVDRGYERSIYFRDPNGIDWIQFDSILPEGTERRDEGLRAPAPRDGHRCAAEIPDP